MDGQPDASAHALQLKTGRSTCWATAKKTPFLSTMMTLPTTRSLSTATKPHISIMPALQLPHSHLLCLPFLPAPSPLHRPPLSLLQHPYHFSPALQSCPDRSGPSKDFHTSTDQSSLSGQTGRILYSGSRSTGLLVITDSN